MFEEDRPRPPAARPLDVMSIEELEARIAALKAEIETCERAIEAKRSHRAAADAFFKGAAS